jgi:lipid II:glycine glycyltransferase (peptidoglycan interpeptide bridge formation enzyme)
LKMESASWDSVIAALPHAHVLQTWEWGQVKARYGWQPLFLVWREGRGLELLHPSSGQPALPGDSSDLLAAALVLRRTITIGSLGARLRVLYTPRGPLLREWNDSGLREQVLVDLGTLARRQGAIFIKLDPDFVLGTGIPATPEAQENPAGRAVADDLQRLGWIYSDEQIQFRNTILLDLTPDETMLLARMKQKARYNIRLASRKGVIVRTGKHEDLGLLYRMYAETSIRDGFVIRDEAYYRTVWKTFLDTGDGAEASCSSHPAAEPLIAEVEGEPVGAVIQFRFAGRAWYMYGMSRELHRDRMPNALLQWEAIRRAKACGCTAYDLWGAPDHFEENDPLWGVYRFKEGLGGKVVQGLGAWDLPVRPFLYRLYTSTFPRLLDLLRRRGKTRTRRDISM